MTIEILIEDEVQVRDEHVVVSRHLIDIALDDG